MNARYGSITKLISEADLSTLMEAARVAADTRELWMLSKDRLSAPSAYSRRTVFRVFCSWYLDGDRPREEPVVLAWHAFPDPQVRREVLHVERCRHLRLLDEFVCDQMYERLRQGQASLFGDDLRSLTSGELDAFVGLHAPHLSEETRRMTREKIRLLLGQAGLAWRTGADFSGAWHYTYYQPTWQAWLYGLYRELEDSGHRKRAQTYILQESRLVRRFLLRPADALALLGEGVRRGALETETFAGEPYVRLTQQDTASLVRTLANRQQ